MSLTEVAAIAGTRCRSPGPWGVHLPQCSPASPFGALTRVPPLPRQSRWFLRRSAVACAAPARMVRAEGMHEAAAAAAATLLRMAAVMGAGDWSHAIRTAAGDDTARGGAAEAWSGNVCRFLLLLQRPLVPRSPAAALRERTTLNETSSVTAFIVDCGGNADGVQGDDAFNCHIAQSKSASALTRRQNLRGSYWSSVATGRPMIFCDIFEM